MIRVAGFEIDPQTLQLVREVYSNRQDFVPLRIDRDGTLRVAVSSPEDEWPIVNALQRRLGLRVVAEIVEVERVFDATQELNREPATEVANCPPEFAFKCPRRWLELHPTEDAAVRFCEGCGREVHLCRDEEELAANARLGRCVAIVGIDAGAAVEFTMGYYDPPDD